ncbi:hypothetical protein E3P91_03165 [Wallemia ichthyophaga]|nr:hypothetical protein E3P91_03165 [Wallemia ichthyophaga]TIA79480.1 hypothetical protein E3P98_03265 [Wallemia ichthyophaga]
MDLVANKTSDYSDISYWDERYTKDAEDTFDWFKQYPDLKQSLAHHIPKKDSRILMLGCGNSSLSRDMYDDGYTNILNIDYSPVCIDNMTKANESRSGMQWCVMDIRQLDLPDNSFDVAIDKGTMDALLAGVRDPWNPQDSIVHDCTSEVREVQRVLKPEPSSVFIYHTYAPPHFRKPLLNTDPDHWDLSVEKMGDWFSYFFYTLRYKD